MDLRLIFALYFVGVSVVLTHEETQQLERNGHHVSRRHLVKRDTKTNTKSVAGSHAKQHRFKDAKIPVSFFLNKTFNTLEEFMENLGFKNDFPFRGHVSSSSVEPSVNFFKMNPAAGYGGEIAVPANCEPQPTIVELKTTNDHLVTYFPICTKVQRCGGCCQHELLHCVPTNSETISVNAMVVTLDPETNQYKREVQPVSLEQHLTCECQCRIRPEDCNDLQDFVKEECVCLCTNGQEAKDCTAPRKTWNPQTCICECRNNLECSTGFFFDEETCTCQPVESNGV